MGSLPHACRTSGRREVEQAAGHQLIRGSLEISPSAHRVRMTHWVGQTRNTRKIPRSESFTHECATERIEQRERAARKNSELDFRMMPQEKLHEPSERLHVEADPNEYQGAS